MRRLRGCKGKRACVGRERRCRRRARAVVAIDGPTAESSLSADAVPTPGIEWLTPPLARARSAQPGSAFPPAGPRSRPHAAPAAAGDGDGGGDAPPPAAERVLKREKKVKIICDV
ncbi:Protein of unknown function [Gryllus bimaculatus]|nr:Protein of unknown function [Gryllus bimaculatus]